MSGKECGVPGARRCPLHKASGEETGGGNGDDVKASDTAREENRKQIGAPALCGRFGWREARQSFLFAGISVNEPRKSEQIENVGDFVAHFGDD